MRIPSQNRSRSLRFNITPLIDIVFLLIIFFLVASHFTRNENVETVELASATNTNQQKTNSPRKLVITITADEKYHVAGNNVTIQEIDNIINSRNEGVDPSLTVANGDDYEVRIRTDKRVPYRLVEPIILSCARAGISNIQFPVIQE